MKPLLRGVGALLRRDQGEQRDAEDHAVERARFMEAAAKARRSPIDRRVAVLAALALAALLVWIVPRPASSELGFVAGPGADPGEVGAYYAASADGQLVLRFDDGSRVTLDGGSGLRVQKATRPEAVVLLERGTARFDVEHEPKRLWRVAAGPYLVRVTGTSFTLDWASASSSLRLQMHEGRVMVSGPGIDGEVAVSGTEELVIGGETRAEPAADPTPTAEHTRVAQENLPAGPAAEDGPRVPPVAGSALAGKSLKALESARDTVAVPWSVRVSHGEHEAVLAAAERRGIEAVLEEASADDLRSLADAARFRGRTALARRSLRTLRARFPGSSDAVAAAFMLGRLDDAAGHVASALDWYEAYLSEGGPLAPEARGRAMVALHKLGRTAEARAKAQEYLERYPDGAYRDHARDIAR